mgnify:CR=1 FL=1
MVTQARLEGLYGQCRKVKTVNSGIERKFGERIRSQLHWLRYYNPIIKELVYNLHC